MFEGYPTDEGGNIQFMIVEAPDYEVNTYEDSLYLFAELGRIATDYNNEVMPIFRLHYEQGE